MPTYEYECIKCSHSFEVFQAMSDEPLKKCPECGKQVRRLIFGGAGVIFKGSGFYVTDKASGKSGGKDVKSAGGTPTGEAPTKTAATATDAAQGASAPPSGEKSKDTGGSTEKNDSAKSKKDSAAKSA